MYTCIYIHIYVCVEPVAIAAATKKSEIRLQVYKNGPEADKQMDFMRMQEHARACDDGDGK